MIAELLFNMNYTVLKPYFTSYDSIYNENVMGPFWYCSLLILRQFLHFTMTGGGVRKITIFLKNETENLPWSFDMF
jgi:hypothetical protein